MRAGRRVGLAFVQEWAVLYLAGITASSIPDLHPELERSAGRQPAARDFLASLNQGRGRELLDAYIENRTDQRRNALAMHYGLCAQVVARQVYRLLTSESRRRVELGDAEQTAMVLLFQLVEKFDCSLGIPLSAFLTRRLRYAMIDEFRKLGLMVRGGQVEGERARCVSLDRGGRELLIEDSRGRSPVERTIAREGRAALLRRVPREYRLFVFYRHVRGMQLWQVAKKLNVTCERAGGMQGECLEVLRREFGVVVDRVVVAPNPHPDPLPPFDSAQDKEYRERGKEGRGKSAAGVLPVELRREKVFRRWFLRRLPWVYRKLVAYRYLRERDIDWTAGKLGICPNKARMLERQARPMLVKMVAEYRGQSGVIAAVA